MAGLKENIFSAFILFYCTLPRSLCIFEEDYCWRDYDGVVPSDAFKAGFDKNQRPVYIGQVLYGNKLVPGNIYENINEIHFEFGNAYTETKNIKILCSQHPEKFRWVKTRHTNVISMTKSHIFVAGYEEDHITYVGRADTYGELTVGKVVCHSNGCYELTTTYEGQWYPHYEFEILTYNPESESATTSLSTTTSSTSIPTTTPYYRFVNSTIISSETTEGTTESTFYPDVTVEHLINSSNALMISDKILLVVLFAISFCK